MVGTVIREALELQRRLLGPLALATMLVFLPLAAAVLALGLAVPSSSAADQGLMIIDGVGSILLFTPLASLIAVRSAMALERDGAASVRRHVGDAFGLLVAFVLTQLLALLVIAALPLALIGAGLALGVPAIALVGSAMLIGSALVNGVRLAVATTAAATGDARLGPALRRSAALTRGRWLATAGTLLAVLAIALVVSLALSLVALPVPAGAARDVADGLVGLVGNAVLVPFVALVQYRLYRVLESRAA